MCGELAVASLAARELQTGAERLASPALRQVEQCSRESAQYKIRVEALRHRGGNRSGGREGMFAARSSSWLREAFAGRFASGRGDRCSRHAPPALGSQLATRPPRRCLSLEKSGLGHCRPSTENPRVGGSVPPWAPIAQT